MSLALRVHDSLPYRATGHTSVFSNLTLIWVPRVRSFHMVESDRSADLAAPRRARISVLQVADSSIMDPKYLNLSTCSSTAPRQAIFNVSFSVVAAITFVFFCADL